MSALGHKRTSRYGSKSNFVRFGPIADKNGCGRIVRLVPIADIAMTSNSPTARPEIFHVPLRIRRVADSANPLGDPLYQKQEPI